MFGYNPASLSLRGTLLALSFSGEPRGLPAVLKNDLVAGCMTRFFDDFVWATVSCLSSGRPRPCLRFLRAGERESRFVMVRGSSV